MYSLNNIQAEAARYLMGTKCHASPKPVLAINAGSAATVKTTNAIDYTIDGVKYTLAALSAKVLAAKDTLQQQITGQGTFYVQPVSTTVYYLLVIDSSGNVYCVQGTYAGQLLTGSNLQNPIIGDGAIPFQAGALGRNTGYCVFGMIKIATGASATFTVATTALDAAGITATYYDLENIPATAP